MSPRDEGGTIPWINSECPSSCVGIVCAARRLHRDIELISGHLLAPLKHHVPAREKSPGVPGSFPDDPIEEQSAEYLGIEMIRGTRDFRHSITQAAGTDINLSGNAGR